MLKHVACWNEKGKKKRTSKKQNVNNQVQSKLSSLSFHEIKGKIGDEMELKIEHVEEKASI